VADAVVSRLRGGSNVEVGRLTSTADGPGTLPSVAEPVTVPRFDVVIYAPPPAPRDTAALDLADAEAVFRWCADGGVGQLVLLSSAAVYGPNPHNAGLLSEPRLSGRNRANPLAEQWLELEALAEKHRTAAITLTILRPAAVPVPDACDVVGRLLGRRLPLVLPGHDPVIQLLSPADLAEAVGRAIEVGRPGTYNVAPAEVIPLRDALRRAGRWWLPVPYAWQRLANGLRAAFGGRQRAGHLEYLRYNWTVSHEAATRELGFAPRRSSEQALEDSRPTQARRTLRGRYDDYGLNERTFAAYARRMYPFLHHCYWRVEVKGTDHLPREGRALLVGVHRGFMPFDGFMTAHLIMRETGRIPRFLIHPGLVKFPFLHDFMTKQGALVACGENADRVLGRDQMLAIYPEGIHGAFALYRHAYELGRFGRDEYVRMALRNRAPIIPFVTLGSAEIFPILGKVEWAWWKRFSEWPFIPITPTFPLLGPVPLPSKWHTWFLEPLHVERAYPPEAADDKDVVRAIGREVKGRMADALAWMRRRRRHIFFGSIFGEPSAPEAEATTALVPGDEARQEAVKVA
jgi:1-acyl-sn-glycerol-3-phosphate acyltransferase/nucleoside-diphosphate-sugar epimerase